MKPRSAKIVDRVRFYDTAGAPRWMKLRLCTSCNVGEWLAFVKTDKCSRCRDMSVPNDIKQKISRTLKDKYKDPQYKKRILDTFNPPSGKDHWNWQGGTSTEREKLMKTDHYKHWRTSVFKRDNYLCRTCGKGGQINAHHIIPWAIDKTKWFDINNGITLCENCHKLVHKYYREVNDQST